jgi:hypothetical protein
VVNSTGIEAPAVFLRAGVRYDAGMENLTLPEELRTRTEASDEPVRVFDPKSNRAYVLVRADLFDRMRELIGGATVREAYPTIDRTFAAGWDDPKMDVYDRFEDLKK